MTNVIKTKAGQIFINGIVCGAYEKAIGWVGGGYIAAIVAENGDKTYLSYKHGTTVFKTVAEAAAAVNAAIEAANEAAEIAAIEAAAAEADVLEQLAAENECYVNIQCDGIMQVGAQLDSITDSPADFAEYCSKLHKNAVIIDKSEHLWFLGGVFDTVGYKSPDGSCELWALSKDAVPIRWLSVYLLSKPLPAYSRDWADEEADEYDKQRDMDLFHSPHD